MQINGAQCMALRELNGLLISRMIAMETPQKRPQPGPDARLLIYARENHVPPLSIRAAARKAGISESRWRQIEKGYSAVSADRFVEAVAPDLTMAAMAMAVGLDGDDLRSVGRDGAARIIDSQREAAKDEDRQPDVSLSQFTDDELLLELRARLTRTGREKLQQDSGQTLTAVVNDEQHIEPIRIAARRAPRKDPSIWEED